MFSKQKLRPSFTFLFTLTLFLAGARSADAVTIKNYTFNVNSTVDENDAAPGDGICSSYPSAKCTLRAAITEANQNAGEDTINVPVGIYTLNHYSSDDDYNSYGDLDIKAAVKIQGPPSGAVTIQAATYAPTKDAGKGRVFDIRPQQSPLPSFSVDIHNVTIRHGFAGPGIDSHGGAIRAYSGLSLHNCVVAKSIAADGFAGGIAVLEKGYLYLYDTTVSDHWAKSGYSAVYSQGDVYMDGCQIEGNESNHNSSAMGFYGGDFYGASTITIYNSTFTRNTFTNVLPQGTISFHGSASGPITATMTNVTIADNTDRILISSGSAGSLTLLNCTFARNSGGGISVSHPTNIRNTLVQGVAGKNICPGGPSASITSQGGNVLSDASCGLSGPGDKNNTAFHLGLLGRHGAKRITTAGLAFGDPILNTATNCPATDARGIARTQWGGCDPGAYEFDLGRTSDFDATGKGDLLWRSNQNGDVFLWQMDGATPTQQGLVQGGIGLNWVILGVGDFNRDKKADILWYDTFGKDIAVWLMNGPMLISGVVLPNDVGFNTFEGIGDFDGDGDGDILLRNVNNDFLTVWYMDGTTVASTSLIGDSDGSTIISVGDFNGDGYDDIMMRNDTTAKVSTFLQGPNPIFVNTPVFLGASMSIVATGRIDRSTIDALLVYDSSNQTYAWWRLANGTFISAEALDIPFPPGYSPIGLADFNGDGYDDMLLRGAVNGDPLIRFMNQGKYVSQASLGPIGSNFDIWSPRK